MSTNPIDKTYQVMQSDNSVNSISPDEIEKVADSKYGEYQQSGPNLEKPDELAIKQQDVHL
jgi:hypothetical protein